MPTVPSKSTSGRSRTRRRSWQGEHKHSPVQFPSVARGLGNCGSWQNPSVGLAGEPQQSSAPAEVASQRAPQLVPKPSSNRTERRQEWKRQAWKRQNLPPSVKVILPYPAEQIFMYLSLAVSLHMPASLCL